MFAERTYLTDRQEVPAFLRGPPEPDKHCKKQAGLQQKARSGVQIIEEDFSIKLTSRPSKTL